MMKAMGISALALFFSAAVFSRQSLTLTAINGAHDVVKYAVMGAIFGG